jgi:hypothetical protein
MARSAEACRNLNQLSFRPQMERCTFRIWFEDRAVRTPALNTFELVLFSKQINAQSDAAIIRAAKLDQQQTPQLEIDHQQKKASDLESMREKNKKSFQP